MTVTVVVPWATLMVSPSTCATPLTVKVAVASVEAAIAPLRLDTPRPRASINEMRILENRNILTRDITDVWDTARPTFSFEFDSRTMLDRPSPA